MISEKFPKQPAGGYSQTCSCMPGASRQKKKYRCSGSFRRIADHGFTQARGMAGIGYRKSEMSGLLPGVMSLLSAVDPACQAPGPCFSPQALRRTSDPSSGRWDYRRGCGQVWTQVNAEFDFYTTDTRARHHRQRGTRPDVRPEGQAA